MTLLKSIADVVGRLVQLIAPSSSEPERPLTEDDIRSDRYLGRQQAGRATARRQGASL